MTGRLKSARSFEGVNKVDRVLVLAIAMKHVTIEFRDDFYRMNPEVTKLSKLEQAWSMTFYLI